MGGKVYTRYSVYYKTIAISTKRWSISGLFREFCGIPGRFFKLVKEIIKNREQFLAWIWKSVVSQRAHASAWLQPLKNTQFIKNIRKVLL